MVARGVTATATADGGGAPEAEIDQRRLRLVFSGLMLGMLLAALDQTIVATALPRIVSDLGGLAHLSWVVTAYLLASTVTTPLWGKLGDLVGRKLIWVTAIPLFLAGSLVCGLAQNMTTLIAGRAVQGLGGGGLMVTAQAIVGDVVPPRDRGRYQGLFGAVFGVSSVAGPLLGGFFVDHLSWRWVFTVNLPVGALALAASVWLPRVRGTARPVIDYLGTATIGGFATCVVLVASLGGSTYAWGSPEIVGFGVAAAVFLVAFLVVERRAREPVMPLRLFRIQQFTLTGVVGLILGFVMFGSITYLPLYLQIVRGASPTSSGLRMIPMMVGVLGASILSGQLISRSGRYKVYPVVGTAVMAFGLYLLSRLALHTGTWAQSAYLLVFGLGIGLTMQVLVLVAQNAVDYSDLGVATSTSTFFRSIGASFGTAVFGAVFTNRLNHNLTADLRGRPLPPGVDADTLRAHPELLHRLPPPTLAGFLHGYLDAIQTMFLVAVPFAVLAFLVTLAFREQPLRGAVSAPDLGEAFGMPETRSSVDEVERALSRLLDKTKLRYALAQVARRAGVDLEPLPCLMLGGALRHGLATREAFTDRYRRAEPVDVERALHTLTVHGLLATANGDGRYRLTDEGTRTARVLIDTRRQMICELLGDGADERHADLAAMLTRLAGSLADDNRVRDSGAKQAASQT
ncbi:MAG: MDR family MFS transporter [Mycobacteriales bacterium]